VGRVTEAPGVPLARLLAIGYRQLVDGLHERLAADGWTDVRPTFGFVLLATRDRSTTTTELAGVLGVSKQATSKLLDQMEAAGYVTRTSSDGDGRLREVALAARGHQLLEAVERIYADLESGWARLVGEPEIERVRATMTDVVLATNDGRLPVVRATP
jgi:DNA-binding MarR family transcriptional regulator